MSQFLTKDKESVDTGGSKKTFTADLTVDRTILDVGEDARVFGIAIANSSSNPAEVTFIDGNTDLKFIETVPSKSTGNIPFIFDTAGGLVAEALTGANANKVFVSVFYSTNFLA